MMRIIDLRENRESGLIELLEGRSRMDDPVILKTVSDIIADVRARGNQAVLEYTEKFDKVKMTAEQLSVTDDEWDQACRETDPVLLNVIKRAKENIWEFHEKQKENSWFMNKEDGIILGQIVRPLNTVGIYVPGGTAVLTSSVLMNAVPAKVAGVKRIVMVTPPRRDGTVEPAVLAAAREAGVDEVYKIGGAQAVAAIAFGTQTVPGVDKIFGPGNIYVATAKRMVYGFCDIDMFAGPSEIAIVADKSANPEFIAADLLSQAEHDILSAAILITDSPDIASMTVAELERQSSLLPRSEIVGKSLSKYGAVVITKDIDQAMIVVNSIAPEHLELCVEEPFSRLGEVENAGAVFLGHYSPEPLGDYFAGPNHVLPTGGTARFFSPLNLSDYMKKSSVISYTKKALEKAKGDIMLFARSEGLEGHARALETRFKSEK